MSARVQRRQRQPWQQQDMPLGVNSSNHQSAGKKKPVDVTPSQNQWSGASCWTQSSCLSMARKAHLKEELCCHSHFQGRLWGAKRSGKISPYCAQHRVFQVIRTGVNVLKSLCLLFYFDIKIGAMVLVHKILSRPSVSGNISQLTALQSSCDFTTDKSR